VLHYAIIGLLDEFDRDVAIQWIGVLMRVDRPGVESGLWRIPSRLLPHTQWLPKVPPAYSGRDDPLFTAVSVELHNEMTTWRKLYLATAFVVNPELFRQLRGEWIQILVRAGDSVFELRAEESAELLRKAVDDRDDLVRFAACFALAVFLRYRLIGEAVVVESLLRAADDGSSAVRLIALYGLSLVQIPQPIAFIQRIRGRSDRDDLMGLCYCIRAWFASLLPLLQEAQARRGFTNQPGLWAFVRTVTEMLAMPGPEAWRDGDTFGIAQFLFLQRSNPKYDQLVDDFMQRTDLAPEEIASAVCGYVPAIAFQINAYDFDERQRKIVKVAQGDEMELLRSLIGHPRRSHRPEPAEGKKVRGSMSVVDQLRKGASEMESGLIRTLLKTLSDSQKEELYRDLGNEHVMIVAIEEKAIGRVAEGLLMKRRSPARMKKIKSVFGRDLEKVVDEMIARKAKLERISDFLVFMRFGEFLQEESQVLFLPSLLADLNPNEFRVVELLRARAPCLRGLPNCLVLRQPHFFEQNEDAFEFFD